MGTTHVALALAAMCAVTAACGGGSGSDAPSAAERPPLPTTDLPEGTGFEAELTGRLEGDAATGCVWLVPTGTGAAADRVRPVWPKGFAARWEPLRLVRASGEPVAGEGDVLVTAGGFATESAAVVPQLPPGCGGGRVWVVSRVQRVAKS